MICKNSSIHYTTQSWKYFSENYRKFGHVVPKSFASPDVFPCSIHLQEVGSGVAIAFCGRWTPDDGWHEPKHVGWRQ
jgi:hypothetical protein